MSSSRWKDKVKEPVHGVEYHPAFQREGTLTCMTGMKLEDSVLSEINPSQEDMSRARLLTGGTRSHWIMGRDSQFYKMKTRLDVAGSDVCTTMTSILKATELCT